MTRPRIVAEAVLEVGADGDRDAGALRLERSVVHLVGIPDCHADMERSGLSASVAAHGISSLLRRPRDEGGGLQAVLTGDLLVGVKPRVELDVESVQPEPAQGDVRGAPTGADTGHCLLTRPRTSFREPIGGRVVDQQVEVVGVADAPDEDTEVGLEGGTGIWSQGCRKLAKQAS